MNFINYIILRIDFALETYMKKLELLSKEELKGEVKKCNRINAMRDSDFMGKLFSYFNY